MRMNLARAAFVGFLCFASSLAAAQPAATSTGTSAPSAAPASPSDAAQGPADVGAAAAGVEGQTSTTTVREDQMDAGTYSVRLRDLEQRINELKEQIFRSKGRLSLLAETVLQGVVAGAQLAIVHENQMSASYRLVRVLYLLDGASIFSQADPEGEGSLGDQESFPVYTGSIVPGEHTLSVNLEYRGHGYGIFSYLKGYRFKVRSSYTFTAPEGRAVTIRAIGLEKGGPTAPLEDRPSIRYVERVSDRLESGTGDAAAAAAAASTSETAPAAPPAEGGD
ncbi:MAG: hypothetical protein U0230_07035 [Polyangiales bacterium]